MRSSGPAKVVIEIRNSENTGKEKAIASIELNKQTYIVRTCDEYPYQIIQTNLYVENISYNKNKHLCL